jgi:hypothetical protein
VSSVIVWRALEAALCTGTPNNSSPTTQAGLC